MPALKSPRLLRLAALVACLPAAALAQDATSLKVGSELSRTLNSTDAQVFTIELADDTFVMGSVNQISVDVVVKFFGPNGEMIAEIDGPAIGPEQFQHSTTEPGLYRIEVLPFEGATGDYTIEVLRAEPVATDPAGKVDQMMASFDGAGMPGGVVGVMRDGELVFARGYGMANLTHGIEFDANTVSNIGSTSKQFTAFAIGLLASEGTLSLDDDIRDHIPELPDLGHTVTVRNLLTHTTGYREFLNLLAMGGRQVGQGDHIDRSEILDIITHQPELQNMPGEEWNYNNSSFVLLTIVVENITGQPFAEWMDENVFTPLGMDDTVCRANRTSVIPNRAAGYVMGESGAFMDVPDLGGAMGAGGIYTTLSDLSKWIDNLHTGALGGKDLIDEMTTSFVLNDGKETGYGLGLFITELGGLTQLHHGGADTAHRSMLMFFPEINAGVVTMSNNAGFDGSIANRVAKAFFADDMEEVKTDPDESEPGSEADSESDAHSIGPDGYDAIVGRYEFEEMPGFVLSITSNEGTLYGQATGQPRNSFTPTTGTTFQLAGEQIFVEFLLEDDGSCPAFMLHQGGEHKATRITEEAWSPDADELETYAGRYFSEELEAFYTLAVVDGTLTIQHRRFELELNTNAQHEFTGGYPVAEVEFVTDDEGNVTGLIASNGRARGVKFVKQD